MNWNSPRADEVVADAFGLKLDSLFAVASRYSKLAPVVEAACLIEPAIFTRVESTPAAAVAFIVSTDICLVPRSPRNDPSRPARVPDRQGHRHLAAIMVNDVLRNGRPPHGAAYRLDMDQLNLFAIHVCRIEVPVGIDK